MESYEIKFTATRNSLIQACKKLVSENHTTSFDNWLLTDADMEFAYAYQSAFKEHFGSFINEDIDAQLWFAGKQLVYLITTFRSVKNKSYPLAELLNFVEIFIFHQLDDFDNDYDTIDWK
jgi:hypothetical protein